MDPYDEILDQLKTAQRRGLETVTSRLTGAVERLSELFDEAKTSIETAIPSEPDSLLAIDEVVAAVERAKEAGGSAAAAQQLQGRLAELEQQLQQAPAAGGLSYSLLSRLDRARSQSELLRELLSVLSEQVDRAAVLVMRDGNISAWSGVGFGDAEGLRQWRAAVSASSMLTRFAEEQKTLLFAPGQDPVFSGWLQGGETPSCAAMIPVCLRGKLVGGIYVDHGKGRRWSPSEFQVLVAIVCWLIDTLGIRQTVPSAMLAEPVDLLPEDEDLESEPEPAPELRSEPEPVLPDEPEPESGSFDPSATVRVDMAQMAAMTAGAEVAPAQPAAAEAAPSLSPEDEARHEEARRFARLLVSEIKLYNEDEVERGRANNDLYQRLKEDIDRSREMFDKRIPPEVRAVKDYFHEELVRILADGNGDVLGM